MITDHQALYLMIGIMWLAWAISCKWMGMFGMVTAIVLAMVTSQVFSK